MIKESIKKPYCFIKNCFLNIRAEKYLKNNVMKMHKNNKRMKIGFIVFEPETWDKLSPIYHILKTKKEIDVKLIIVPSFDQELKLTIHFGKELQYFSNIDSDYIPAYKMNEWINIENDGYDYVFYQDPYNVHMPSTLRSNNVVRFTKICYVPYGFIGSDVFLGLATDSDFFRNVYLGFMDSIKTIDVLNKKFDYTIKNGLQHFYDVGYPAYEKYFNYKCRKGIKRILWTPRWSYDPKVGGSHFFEYKDEILSLKEKFNDISIVIRPHPMMFSNFINEGKMSIDEYNDFIELAKKKGIEISIGNDISNDFNDTDLLITDYSSIFPMYFLTGRPVIYCNSIIKLNKEYAELADVSYQCDNWEKIEQCVANLIEGHDPLKIQREKVIKLQKKKHIGSAERICEIIINDYNKNVI